MSDRTPDFVAPYVEPNSGVDFLGLRAVNLNHVFELLPGINNGTHFIRPYSVMAWTAWKFAEQLKASRRAESDYEVFRAFQEKVEILFTWSHALHNAAQGVGAQQKQPNAGLVAAQPLDFESWQRRGSWMDPAVYGPSIRDEQGLGFLRQVHPGIYAVTEPGRRLADALDARLKHAQGYARLCSLTDFNCSATLAKSLYKAWNMTQPRQREQEIFAQALVDHDADPNSIAGKRLATVHYLLSALQSNQRPVTEAQLREQLTYGSRRQLERSGTVASNSQIRARWRVLQVRQAQRLALETLLRWIEGQVMHGSATHSSELVANLSTLLNADDDWLNAQLLQFEEAKGPQNSYFSRHARQNRAGILDLTGHLSDLLLSGASNDVARHAVIILILCAAISEEFCNEALTTKHLRDGGTQRISLAHWQRFIANHRHAPTKTFLLRMIENYVLSQHFGVAASRYTEGSQRLRLSIEENGLVAMVAKPLLPAITPDRLGAILSLLSECKLIKRTLVDGVTLYAA